VPARDVEAKTLANHDVPCGPVLLVHRFLDHLGRILWQSATHTHTSALNHPHCQGSRRPDSTPGPECGHAHAVPDQTS
jgi:hypothetical protein